MTRGVCFVSKSIHSQDFCFARKTMTTAYINKIATAAPQHDVHRAFIDFAEGMLPEGTARNLFRRMVRMSAIEHRYSFLRPIETPDGTWRDAENLYVQGDFP